MIASGREAALASESENEGEWRKMLTAVLREGSELLIIDNLARPLSSAQLAKFVTAAVWEDRVLAVSEMAVPPQRLTLIVTGNNVALGGDMARRCVLIKLDPRSARPWLECSYPHPELLDWVAEQRGAIVAALLTVVGAWVSAGRPAAAVRRLAGFGRWSATVGSILAHAGIDGFLANLETAYESLDVEAEQWEAFLAEA